MWNRFEVPLTEIRDRALRFYLGFDYFHDSWITSIDYRRGEGRLTLELGAEREGASYATREDPRYQYQLTFLRCDRVFIDTMTNVSVYINGRFKRPRMDRRPEGVRARPHLFRIQLAGGGVIDIQFREFAITRTEGEVRLPRRVTRTMRHFDRSSVAEEMSLAEVRRRAEQKDEFAIAELAIRNDRRGADIVASALSSRDDLVVAAAVHAIGLLGSPRHLPALAAVFRYYDTPFDRRQIAEAMERIALRGGRR